jgi:hypothetical protein
MCATLIACGDNAPSLVASGKWTGWSPGDSGYVIPGTINGHRIDFVVDYGSNAVALTERAFVAAHLPIPYANATRVATSLRRPGVEPVLDSTANATTQVGDTIKQYWGNFEPLIVDSLRLGASLQRYVYLPGSMPSSVYSHEALIGRDVISQFDVEIDGRGGAIRFYERAPSDSSVHGPRWLPRGVTPSDCLSAIVVGPRSMPTPEPDDTAGLSDAERREQANGMVAMRRLYDQIELQFPTLIDGKRIDATYDSGTSDAIINWAAARMLGLTPPNLRVRPDTAAPGTATIVGSTLRVGGHTLAAPEVFIADGKFVGGDGYLTKPMMLLGLRQFRDRVLFMSHSTGTICIGPVK